MTRNIYINTVYRLVKLRETENFISYHLRETDDVKQEELCSFDLTKVRSAFAGDLLAGGCRRNAGIVFWICGRVTVVLNVHYQRPPFDSSVNPYKPKKINQKSKIQTE